MSKRAPLRSERRETDRLASLNADPALRPERENWPICTRTLFGRCNDGRMESWRGSDGHCGTEWFQTCDRCGATT